MGLEIVAVFFIVLFAFLYYVKKGDSIYNFVMDSSASIYEKYAPYSFKMIRAKIKELGQEYSTKQYVVQIAMFAGGAFLISYLYFYNPIISIVYTIIVVCTIPYLTFLRCKRIYSEFIFEQIQVYTTNTIMEFQTTQSFVKALEGVYTSGVLQDPVLTDLKVMIDMAYQNGDIQESLNFMNGKYEFHMTKNMHQLFLQITKEGAHDSTEVLENMLLDIDMLIEGVYRDRLDRQQFHKQFVQYGLMLYLMIMLVQFLLGIDTYLQLLDENIVVVFALHIVVLFNSYFLLAGEKYYNENVGAE